MSLAQISLTLSRHFSSSFMDYGRSSGLHPVSSHTCCIYVRPGRPAFARPYVGVHRSTSLMSSSLFLQQCPACLIHLTWIVFVMGAIMIKTFNISTNHSYDLEVYSYQINIGTKKKEKNKPKPLFVYFRLPVLDLQNIQLF